MPLAGHTVVWVLGHHFSASLCFTGTSCHFFVLGSGGAVLVLRRHADGKQSAEALLPAAPNTSPLTHRWYSHLLVFGVLDFSSLFLCPSTVTGFWVPTSWVECVPLGRATSKFLSSNLGQDLTSIFRLSFCHWLKWKMTMCVSLEAFSSCRIALTHGAAASLLFLAFVRVAVKVWMLEPSFWILCLEPDLLGGHLHHPESMHLS